VFFILQIFYLLEWLFHRSGRPCILLCHLCVPVKWGDDESVLYLWNISKVIEPRLNTSVRGESFNRYRRKWIFKKFRYDSKWLILTVFFQKLNQNMHFLFWLFL